MVSYINIVHAIIPVVIAIVCLRIIFVHYYQLPPSSNFDNNINYSIEKNISLSQQFFRQGLLAYQNRRYQLAHQLLLNATKTDPFYADAYYNLAIVEETIFHNFESAFLVSNYHFYSFQNPKVPLQGLFWTALGALFGPLDPPLKF